MLVGGRHDSVRFALALIVLLLTAVASTSGCHTVSSACLKVTAAWTSVSSVQVRVMLHRETGCDDFVSSGG